MLVNIGWPRDKVYDVEGESWYLHYFPQIFVGGALAIGAVALPRDHSAAAAPCSRTTTRTRRRSEPAVEGSPA